MYLGELVEIISVGGTSREHPGSLHADIPVGDIGLPKQERQATAAQGIRCALHDRSPSECRFHIRCPEACKVCARRSSDLFDADEDHPVACFRV
jgi:ABC-type dipeptide/oligopeptide/nickel transport system ATPase component